MVAPARFPSVGEAQAPSVGTPRQDSPCALAVLPVHRADLDGGAGRSLRVHGVLAVVLAAVRGAERLLSGGCRESVLSVA